MAFNASLRLNNDGSGAPALSPTGAQRRNCLGSGGGWGEGGTGVGQG
jgi:hypothetical protein